MRKARATIGPGTLISVTVAAIVVGFYWVGNNPSSSPLASPTPAKTSAQTPLRKPVPGDLLRLKLEPAQAARVRSLDASWRKERDLLVDAMRTASAPAQEPNRSLPQLRAGLQEYAELSRRYDRVRRAHWEAAVASLRPSQRKEIEKP